VLLRHGTRLPRLTAPAAMGYNDLPPAPWTRMLIRCNRGFT
jgi:hypothetical protein